MRADDLDRVAGIEQSSFPAPWSRDQLSIMLRLPGSQCFVLEAEGKVQAYAGALKEAEELHIVNLAVDPDERRKGYANMLVNWLEERGVELGCPWVYLEVRTSNIPAIMLYQSLGYRIIRILPGYYQDSSDAFQMRKGL